jgi:hypothetical protein
MVYETQLKGPASLRFFALFQKVRRLFIKKSIAPGTPGAAQA